LKKIVLKKGKEASLQRRHPWVFSGAIAQVEHGCNDGELVSVSDYQNRVLGYGHYQQNGSISIRILAFSPEAYFDGLYEERLKRALQMRINLGLVSSSTNCFRLVHGEGDDLPSLIIDIYNNNAVVQCHSMGMFRQVKLIADSLDNIFDKRLNTIYCKSSATLHLKPGEADFFLKGSDHETIALENGHHFKINWVEGQKTGFFLDQRDNRFLVGQLAQGRNVFNAFCYTGGFSVYALANGASSVTSIDSSQKAMDLVEANAGLVSGVGERHTSFRADVIEWLKAQSSASFDLAIVDPPAFAKSHAVRHKASLAYRRLNAEAMRLVQDGAYLLTFSCSQAIDSATFRSIVFAAGIDAGKRIQVLKQLSQGVDHPVNLYHPEGEYLKGLLLRID